MNLKEIRKSHGMTQKQLAEKAGINIRQLQKYESGEYALENMTIKTAEAVSKALGCSVDVLTNPNKKEEEDMKEKIMVERCYVIHGTDDYLVEKEGEYYLLSWKRPNNSRMRKVDSKDWAKAKIKGGYEVQNYMYVMLGLEKRTGYDVKVGRAITSEELEELKRRYNLDEKRITEPFEDKRGAIFGEEWQKTFTSVQIAVDPLEALSLEKDLVTKGIEAANVAAGRVNVRIE